MLQRNRPHGDDGSGVELGAAGAPNWRAAGAVSAPIPFPARIILDGPLTDPKARGHFTVVVASHLQLLSQRHDYSFAWRRSVHRANPLGERMLPRECDQRPCPMISCDHHPHTGEVQNPRIRRAIRLAL